MSRVFVDQDLLTWEAYVSSGSFGLPEHAHILFNPISHPDARARYVVFSGGVAEAQDAVGSAPEARLRELLAGARPLD